MFYTMVDTELMKERKSYKASNVLKKDFREYNEYDNAIVATSSIIDSTEDNYYRVLKKKGDLMVIFSAMIFTDDLSKFALSDRGSMRKSKTIILGSLDKNKIFFINEDMVYKKIKKNYMYIVSLPLGKNQYNQKIYDQYSYTSKYSPEDMEKHIVFYNEEENIVIHPFVEMNGDFEKLMSFYDLTFVRNGAFYIKSKRRNGRVALNLGLDFILYLDSGEEPRKGLSYSETYWMD